MNPYIIMQVCLIGPDEGIPEEQPSNDKVVKARWQPDQIQGYVPGFYWGSMVYMLGGASFLTPLSCDQIDGMLAAYWNRVNSNENSKSTILTLQ